MFLLASGAGMLGFDIRREITSYGSNGGGGGYNSAIHG